MRPLILVLLLATAARADNFLIKGANVLPQEGPALEGDVLIEGDRVVAVGAHLDPGKATVIEAKGLYVIPGLIDVHAHIAEQRIFPDLFVPHGVTTVRDMGNRLEDVEKLAASPPFSRPEVLYVGPILDGNPPIWPMISEVVEQKDAVPALLARLKEHKVCAFKVYENLEPAVYDAILAEARKLGVPVVGHVPKKVGLLHCVESGQDTIEHLDHFAPALSKTGGELSFTAELTGWNDVDEAKEKDLIGKLLAKKTKLDPTRLVVTNYSLALRGVTPETWGMEFVPKLLRDTFWGFFSGKPRADAETDKAHEASLARALVFVKKAADAGVPILCGSDTPNPFVVPGASVAQEIEELAKALGPVRALECATLANARALGRDDLGKIVKGARADLVLLSKDPRSDARAVRAIEGVFVRGHYHDRKWLDAARKDLAERARTVDSGAAVTGFESIAGPLSDRKPLSPEWRFEGKLASYPASFWARARVFEGNDGQRMTFLRSAGSLPVPVRASEDMVQDREGKLVRYHMAVDAMGALRETTVERGESSWRVQLFEKGEKKSEVQVPLEELLMTRGELLFLEAATRLDLDEGKKTERKLRFVDLDQMKVLDAVACSIRRKKNPVTDMEDPRAPGRYFLATPADERMGKLGAWVATNGQPLGLEVQLPFGNFVVKRVDEASKKKYY
jgi:imidazolonepropionase-like amidohydrolase